MRACCRNTRGEVLRAKRGSTNSNGRRESRYVVATPSTCRPRSCPYDCLPSPCTCSSPHIVFTRERPPSREAPLAALTTACGVISERPPINPVLVHIAHVHDDVCVDFLVRFEFGGSPRVPAAWARGTVGGGTLRSHVAIPSLSAPALGRARQEVVDLADPTFKVGRRVRC